MTYKDRLGIEFEKAYLEVAKTKEVLLEDFLVSELKNTKRENQKNVIPRLDPHTSMSKLRRSSKVSRPPQRYSPALNCVLLIDRGELNNYKEALQVDESIKWVLATKDEMDSLLSNYTWQLAELPKGKKAMQNK